MESWRRRYGELQCSPGSAALVGKFGKKVCRFWCRLFPWSTFCGFFSGFKVLDCTWTGSRPMQTFKIAADFAAHEGHWSRPESKGKVSWCIDIFPWLTKFRHRFPFDNPCLIVYLINSLMELDQEFFSRDIYEVVYSIGSCLADVIQSPSCWQTVLWKKAPAVWKGL